MLNRHQTVKVMAGATFGLNVVSISYGFIYAISQDKAPMQTLFGLAVVAALLLNLGIAYWNHTYNAALRLQRWGTAYLIASVLVMVILPVAGFAASSAYDPRTATTIILVAVYPAYMAVLFLGALQAGATYSAYPGSRKIINDEVTPPETRDSLSRGRKILLTCLMFILFSGLLLAYILLSRYPGLLQVVVSPNALFLAFFYPALAILAHKIYNKPRSLHSLATSTVGLVLMIVFMLPLLMTPTAANQAETSFRSAFGENWQEQIKPAVTDQLRPSRFSLPAYFLGYFPGNYIYQKDILYYEGAAGSDEGIKLHFDVFMPSPKQPGLPGEGSTIIRIHGGAWIAGSKGLGNMMQMNKHLASLGYTVFDIQYGLTNRVNLPRIMFLYDFLDNITGPMSQLRTSSSLGAFENVTGPFTLDDMMRHLGLFTDYLVENAEEYGASTDSVFISGGSAGGHLTTAMTLAIAGGEHNHLFNPEIKIKGYIPFYPANRATLILEEIGGAEEWIDVEKLIRPDSPPCLIFQGAKDGMVPRETASHFRESYIEAGNANCAVIYMPLAAHAADYLFAGNYNQIFLYYMERFMVLHQ